MRIDQREKDRAEGLERELKSVLNRYSQENGSNTPDFILAEYLLSCLESWNYAVTAREKWYGREPKFSTIPMDTTEPQAAPYTEGPERLAVAKSRLREPYDSLEGQIIETLLAGHKEWRPDLAYPESHSDMQGAVRGLLRMFDVKRRAIALETAELYPKAAPSTEGQGERK